MIKFRKYIPLLKCDIAGIGTAVSGVASASASVYAADKQFEATRETNETNKQLAKERNDLEYQMFGEANEFNAEQAQLSREHALMMQKDAQEYNSITSQIERAQQAHINPAAVLGQSTSVGVNSANAQAQSVSPPNMVAAQMQTPDLSALQGISQAFSQFGQSAESFARAKNLNADTKNKMTYGKYADQIHQAGLDLSKSEMRKNYASASQMEESVNLIKGQVEEVQQHIALMASQGKVLDEEAFGKAIENSFKGAEIQARIKNIQSITGFNDIQSKWLAETFVARAYGVTLQNQLTSEQVGLTKSQAQYYDELTNLTHTSNAQACFDFQMNRLFTSRERSQGLRLGENRLRIGDEELSSLEWNNSTPVRLLHEAEGLVSSVGSAVGGAGVFIGARAAAKRKR